MILGRHSWRMTICRRVIESAKAPLAPIPFRHFYWAAIRPPLPLRLWPCVKRERHREAPKHDLQRNSHSLSFVGCRYKFNSGQRRLVLVLADELEHSFPVD